MAQKKYFVGEKRERDGIYCASYVCLDVLHMLMCTPRQEVLRDWSMFANCIDLLLQKLYLVRQEGCSKIFIYLLIHALQIDRIHYRWY